MEALDDDFVEAAPEHERIGIKPENVLNVEVGENIAEAVAVLFPEAQIYSSHAKGLVASLVRQGWQDDASRSKGTDLCRLAAVIHDDNRRSREVCPYASDRIFQVVPAIVGDYNGASGIAHFTPQLTGARALRQRTNLGGRRGGRPQSGKSQWVS